MDTNPFERAFRSAQEEDARRRASEAEGKAEMLKKKQHARSVLESYLKSLAPVVRKKLVDLGIPLNGSPGMRYWDLGRDPGDDMLTTGIGLTEDERFIDTFGTKSVEEGYEKLLSGAHFRNLADSGNEGHLCIDEDTNVLMVRYQHAAMDFAQYLGEQVARLAQIQQFGRQ